MWGFASNGLTEKKKRIGLNPLYSDFTIFVTGRAKVINESLGDPLALRYHAITEESVLLE